MNLKEYLTETGITQSEFATKLGLSQGLIAHWTTGRTRIGAEKVLSIEAATNGSVTRSELRPDLYPPPETPEAA